MRVQAWVGASGPKNPMILAIIIESTEKLRKVDSLWQYRPVCQFHMPGKTADAVMHVHCACAPHTGTWPPRVDLGDVFEQRVSTRGVHRWIDRDRAR